MRKPWLIFIGIFVFSFAVLSLLPVGLLQTYQSGNAGYWHVRSPEFMQTDLMQFLRLMRMPGDSIFAVGALVFCYFTLDLMFGQKNPDGKTIVDLEAQSAGEAA
jgi:nitric oxide reductase subunit B